MTLTYESNCLVHHGIRGQKWGVRRFQNPDGSLTSLGKKRAASGGDSEKKRDWKPSDAENLSDEELNRRNSRLQREKQYKDMTKTRGQKIKEEIGKAAKAILVTSAVTALSVMVKKKYVDLFKTAEDWIKSKPILTNTTLKQMVDDTIVKHGDLNEEE